MGEYEWTSKDNVKPLSKEHIPSVLEEMLQQGVQVYFVDTETYERFQQHTTIDFLQGLVSENQKRGIGVKSL